MLRKLKNARFGQIALVLASLLAITGSLGLHPEPTGALSTPTLDGLTRWDGPRVQDGARHDCLACLAHRSLSLLGPSGIGLEPGVLVALVQAPRSVRPLAAPLRIHAGRAPPALA
jgi:hypothetical protein